jgi:hypothetical protein
MPDFGSLADPFSGEPRNPSPLKLPSEGNVGIAAKQERRHGARIAKQQSAPFNPVQSVPEFGESQQRKRR